MAWSKVGNIKGGAGSNTSTGTAVASDGTFNLETLSTAAFYGFKFDPTTGRLTVDKNTGDAAVRFPQDPADFTDPKRPAIKRPDDYVNWTFSQMTLAFSWDTTQRSHLLMGVSS